MIACLHLHHFATTLMQQAHSLSLDQPLVLMEQDQVYASCAHAEQAGVRPQMSERTARSLLPLAHFQPAQPFRDAEVLATILSIIQSHTDAVEPVPSPQQARVLLEIPVQRRADRVAMVQTIGREVRHQVVLNPAVGIAPGTFTAQTVARQTTPGWVRYVAPGQEPEVLAPLAIEMLGLSLEICDRLHRLGLHTVGQFAALPASAVLQQFGKAAHATHQLARGRDTTPLRPRVAPLAIEYGHGYEEAVTHAAPLQYTLKQFAAAIADELFRRRTGAMTLWLVLVEERGARYERRRTLREAVRSAAAIESILSGLMAQIHLRSGVVEVRAIAQNLVASSAGVQQLSFFERLTPKTTFQQLLPRLVQRHGATPFLRASVRSERQGWLPEEQFDLQALIPL